MADDNKAQTTLEQQTQTQFERLPTFGSLYTNNVQVEHSAFDCKLIFGQYDGSNLVKQHFAVTMAWAEAKAVANLLFANIAFYEGINGPIKMPVGMTPTRPKFENAEQNPVLKKVQDKITKIQAVVFGED